MRSFTEKDFDAAGPITLAIPVMRAKNKFKEGLENKGGEASLVVDPQHPNYGQKSTGFIRIFHKTYQKHKENQHFSPKYTLVIKIAQVL